MNKKLNIDWIQLAQSEIIVRYECPICDFNYHNRVRIEEHIRQFHTHKEIKEICTE